jgi:hypothetical protein
MHLDTWVCTVHNFTNNEIKFIQAVFNDTNGWLLHGKQIQIVDNFDSSSIMTGKKFKIHKFFDKEMAKKFPEVHLLGLSVTDRRNNITQVYIHGENWNQLPPESDYTVLREYRIALINHEVAHVFGYNHVSCQTVGLPSDVRQQPSLSLGGCTPTTSVILNKESKEWY